MKTITVNRDEVIEAFEMYTLKYDMEDPKIKLKSEHTYRVAKLSEEIIGSVSDIYGLTKEDIDLAWLIGMLHDIGRFEQVRIYGTFIDADSVNHAEFGADILFGSKASSVIDINSIPIITTDEQAIALNKIRANIPDLNLVEKAIRNHNRYRIEEGLSEREELFANIIRDADKIDILKVNTDFTVEEIYNVSMEELLESDISDAVLEAALDGHAVDRRLKMTSMDSVIAHASMMQELVFPISRSIVKKQGYLKRLLDKPSNNKETLRRLELIRDRMADLI